MVYLNILKSKVLVHWIEPTAQFGCCVHSKYPILGQKTFAYFSFAKQLLKKEGQIAWLYLCSDLIEILSLNIAQTSLESRIVTQKER